MNSAKPSNMKHSVRAPGPSLEGAQAASGTITVHFLPSRGFQDSWEVILAETAREEGVKTSLFPQTPSVLPTFVLLGKRSPREGLVLVLGHSER